MRNPQAFYMTNRPALAQALSTEIGRLNVRTFMDLVVKTGLKNVAGNCHCLETGNGRYKSLLFVISEAHESPVHFWSVAVRADSDPAIDPVASYQRYGADIAVSRLMAMADSIIDAMRPMKTEKVHF